jgi:hypothetical protein
MRRISTDRQPSSKSQALTSETVPANGCVQLALKFWTLVLPWSLELEIWAFSPSPEDAEE